jgi:flagellar motor switch protein FliG
MCPRPTIKLGGIHTAARIVSGMSLSGADAVLNQLYEIDTSLAEQISDQIVPFEKLAIADARSLQTLVREIEPTVLMIALRGLAKNFRDPFLNSMSSRAKALFLEEMEAMGPIRRSDVEAARAAVTRCARNLAEQDRFALPQAGLVR